MKQTNQRIIQFQNNHIEKLDPAMIKRIEWLDSYPSGQRWLDRIVKATKTHEVYLYLFKKFCDTVKKNPDELLLDFMEAQTEFLTKQKPNFVVQDLMTQEIPKMNMVNGSPITASCMRQIQTAVSAFFRANGFLLHFTFTVSKPNIKGLPTIAEIEEMLNCKIECHHKSFTEFYFVRNQAFISFFASTGFRPETVSLLKWLDLKPTNNAKIPIVIVVDPTRMKGKGATQRYTFTYQTSFLHQKAYDYLMKYKAMIKPKDSYPLFTCPHKQAVTSINRKDLWQLFDNISKAVWGTDKKGKPNKRYACNSFRHFVTNAYTFANLQNIDILMLTGHAVTDIMKFYVNVDPNNPMQHPKIQDLLIKYQSALPYLTY